MIDKFTKVVDLLNAAKDLVTKIAGEKSSSLRLDSLNNLGISTTTITVGNPFARWVQGLAKDEFKFSTDTVYNVRVFELKPMMRELTSAVRRIDDTITVDFSQCLQSETCRLEVQYRMDPSYLSALVHSRSSPEPLGDETKFNLSAQLTDPGSLLNGFNEMEINDYPVTARVYVKENINPVIPGLDTFKALRKLESDMFSNYNPREGFKMAGMQHERFALKRKLQQEDPTDVLRALNMLLLPAHFRTYIRMEQQDFRYHSCMWGLGKMEMPGNIFLPEDMDIITRTDLSLDRKAASGVLYYAGGKFAQDVKDTLETQMKRSAKKKQSQDGTGRSKPP